MAYFELASKVIDNNQNKKGCVGSSTQTPRQPKEEIFNLLPLKFFCILGSCVDPDQVYEPQQRLAWYRVPFCVG